MKNAKVPFIMFALGAIPSWICFYFYFQQLASFDWPTTEASITEVRDLKTSEGLLTLQIYYEFEMDGKMYSGVSQPNDELGEYEAQYQPSYEQAKLNDAWKAKKTVLVHFNAENPSSSTASPSTNGGLLVGGIFAGLLAVLGFLGVITALMGGRKNAVLNESEAKEVMTELEKRIKK